MVRIALLLIILVFTASLLAQSDPQPETPASPEVLAQGLAVYKQYYCGVCHQLEAANTKGAFGPSHDNLGETAAARIADPSYTGIAANVQGYLRESILDPKAYVVAGYAATPHQMPAYTQLSDEELEALVLFLAAQ